MRIKQASESCIHGCFANPFLSLSQSTSASQTGGATAFAADFDEAIRFSLHPNTQFTNHESLPPLPQSFSNFSRAYPQYAETNQADEIRTQFYHHLKDHVCLDYTGHGLFSHAQKELNRNAVFSADFPSYEISYKSVDLNSQILYGNQETEFESKIRKRIMGFLNVSETDYSMVFTANQSSAFRILIESYPFHSHRKMITVYDYESEAVGNMMDVARKRGARVESAQFSWPGLNIQSGKLREIVVRNRKKRNKGLFVFPLQSKVSGARYSYQWLSMAVENGWHVLLDASALGPKDMDTLGLSLFRPDFLICSFYKVFGENPSGFGCLFVKKTSASVFAHSTMSTSIGIIRLVPFQRGRITVDKVDVESPEPEGPSVSSEIVEEERQQRLSSETMPEERQEGPPNSSKTVEEETVIECKGLDHADAVGLILISTRARYQINWLVNALMSLQHPNSDTGLPLIRIYGPKVKFDRAPAVAFNVFDWKGDQIDPILVQKLADRNHISLGYGVLCNVWFSDKHNDCREFVADKKVVKEASRKNEKSEKGIPVVTAALGFLTNFEDIYRVWFFVSRFLDADFVEKERWRYKALNQRTIVI